MADRFPLIANPSTRQIEELSVADNLDLTGNSIVGLSTISTNTLTVNTVTGTSLNFSGNVLASTLTGTLQTAAQPNVTSLGTLASLNVTGDVSIGGTLTYEDVTNVDSVGLITARNGISVSGGDIKVGSGITLSPDGNAFHTGIVTARSGVDFSSLLREGVNITAGKLSDNLNIDLSNGMVHLFTTTETTTSTPNIRLDGSNSLNSKMSIGEAVTVVIIVTAAAGGYSAQLTIDGSAVTEEWLGGSAPSAGGSGGYDVYNHNIIKTADATYVVLSNIVNYA
tara:strand:+ start:28 stop:870 length:843 start_codon:yes stop_codon:yes gene_type:complete